MPGLRELAKITVRLDERDGVVSLAPYSSVYSLIGEWGGYLSIIFVLGLPALYFNTLLFQQVVKRLISEDRITFDDALRQDRERALCVATVQRMQQTRQQPQHAQRSGGGGRRRGEGPPLHEDGDQDGGKDDGSGCCSSDVACGTDVGTLRERDWKDQHQAKREGREALDEGGEADARVPGLREDQRERGYAGTAYPGAGVAAGASEKGVQAPSGAGAASSSGAGAGGGDLYGEVSGGGGGAECGSVHVPGLGGQDVFADDDEAEANWADVVRHCTSECTSMFHLRQVVQLVQQQARLRDVLGVLHRQQQQQTPQEHEQGEQREQREQREQQQHKQQLRQDEEVGAEAEDKGACGPLAAGSGDRDREQQQRRGSSSDGRASGGTVGSGSDGEGCSAVLVGGGEGREGGVGREGGQGRQQQQQVEVAACAEHVAVVLQ